MPKSCWTGSGGTALLMRERNVLQTQALAFLFFFFYVLWDIQSMPRGDGQAETGGIAFHHIYNSCWVPSATSKPCITSPSARDHKEHLMKCPYSYLKEKRTIPGGVKRRRPECKEDKLSKKHNSRYFVICGKKSHRSLRYRLRLSHQINPRNLSWGTNFIGFCLVEGMRCFPALTLR